MENIFHDYWNVDGDRIEKPPGGKTLSGERLTRKQTTSRPGTSWPEIWKAMSDASKRKEKLKWAIEKPKLDNARKIAYGTYLIDPDDKACHEECA